jgi:hypothetical protein
LPVSILPVVIRQISIGYLLVVPFLKACPVVEKYPVSSFFGAKTVTITALCIKTFSITIKEHNTQHNALCAVCCYAECHIFIVILSVVGLSVIILSVAVLLCLVLSRLE